MTPSVVARLAALKTTPTPGLKALWRELFATEAPPYNRRFLESRLGYRIQELAYGGLKPETVERLDALADALDVGTRARTPALLKGLIFGPTGAAFTPTHPRRKGKLYRYYVSSDTLKRGMEDKVIGRLPAAEIEGAVIQQIRILLRSPEMIVRTWRTARKASRDLTESDVREALERFDELWDELFPAEQGRIVQLLVERIDVVPGAADVRLRVAGLTSLLEDVKTTMPAREAA